MCDKSPRCPYAVIVQQIFLQFISLILFPHLKLATLELAIYFLFPVNNVALSVSWSSLDIVFLICSSFWLHSNVIQKNYTRRESCSSSSRPSHINHQFIRSLVFVFFNNSYNGWESPPNNIFIIQVTITEIPCFFIQSQQLTGFQSQM